METKEEKLILDCGFGVGGGNGGELETLDWDVEKRMLDVEMEACVESVVDGEEGGG